MKGVMKMRALEAAIYFEWTTTLLLMQPSVVTWQDSSTTVAMYDHKYYNSHCQYGKQLFHFLVWLFDFLFLNLPFYPCAFPSVAKLLCQSHYCRSSKEDCYLLTATYHCKWRDHLWLQVPYWGWEDSLSVCCGEL